MQPLSLGMLAPVPSLLIHHQAGDARGTANVFQSALQLVLLVNQRLESPEIQRMAIGNKLPGNACFWKRKPLTRRDKQ